jgi:hypothetical protein
MAEHPVEKGIADVLRTYELLDRVRTRQDLIVRDDQFEPSVFLDAAATARRRRFPMGLLDTGRLSVGELEGLARRGVRIWTSDAARPRPEELAILVRACRRSRSFLAFLLEGDWPAGEDPGPLSSQALDDLVSSGMDLHLSNRRRERRPELLADVARKAGAGRSFLVYYHHGPLVPELAEPAALGAWLHFTDRSVADDEAAVLACAIARAASAGHSRAVVTVERPLAPDVLEGLWAAGAVLRFLTPPAESRSALAAIERKAGKRKAPPRAAYLFGVTLP